MVNVPNPNLAARIVSSANSVNKTTIKDHGPCTIYQAIGYNSNAAARFLKIYDVDPTVGTTAPKLTIPLPPSTAFSISVGGDRPFELRGGAWMALTTGAADNDAAAVGAAEILGLNVLYR